MRLEFSESDLSELVERVVRKVLHETESQRARFDPQRLCYPEPEAAALMGVQPHVLRDARRRGELTGSKVGKRIVYQRDDLQTYLDHNRVG